VKRRQRAEPGSAAVAASCSSSAASQRAEDKFDDKEAGGRSWGDSGALVERGGASVACHSIAAASHHAGVDKEWRDRGRVSRRRFASVPNWWAVTVSAIFSIFSPIFSPIVTRI